MNRLTRQPLRWPGVVLALFLLTPSAAFAVDSLCARVKLEIRQEMTLERQAFDAHMAINNGLSHITLENVDIDVAFSDETGAPVLASSDPDNAGALFFIDVDSMENITDVNGAGTVEPSSTADVHWLIIPAPGASNGVPQGTLYYVGATLTYTLGGEEHVMEVVPDYIFVKPMPELTLDYFIPYDVYGDDAFTPEIEPPEPFSLGVRAANNGAGTARNLSINSAQPKIVENELGLLIGFNIQGSEVNGRPERATLQASLGDIASGSAAVARWVMTTSLSGRFVEFTADFSHSDELGGELTSLLENVATHFLARDVLVDLPGRDGIRDFLAEDAAGSGVFRVYEAVKLTSEVASASGVLSGGGYARNLVVPATTGFLYVKLPDPFGGEKVIEKVVRSDGKRISTANAWLSKTRDEDNNWSHFINLFDADTTDSYALFFAEPEPTPRPPVLGFIADRSAFEGQQVSFIVEADDPDGTVPMLSASPLPAGASFTDGGDGIGVFAWTPAAGQAGTYEITYVASDGALKDTQAAVIIVAGAGIDADGDGMADTWEMEHFGTMDRDGGGDFDGDGVSDLDEYLLGTDPTQSNAPSTPVVASPAVGSSVAEDQPTLIATNSTDPDGDPVSYQFEIYSDSALTTLVAASGAVEEGPGATGWQVPTALAENGLYFWRVRAGDGHGWSEWAYGRFTVNVVNEPPGAFAVSAPADDTEVATLTPELSATNSADPDGDVVTYRFEVYADAGMAALSAHSEEIAQGSGGTTSWVVNPELSEDTLYYWRAVASDPFGASAATPLSTFFVNTQNAAPTSPTALSPVLDAEVPGPSETLTVSNAADPDDETLWYLFELDQTETFGPDTTDSGWITEGTATTSWLAEGLQENTRYYWRTKASDGAAESPWTSSRFFVNSINEAPSTPTVLNPGEGAWVTTRTPELSVNASSDPDGDDLVYEFEVWPESAPSLALTGGSDATHWTVAPELLDNVWHLWQARALDQHGEASGWTAPSRFFVDENGVDDPPVITLTEPSSDIALASGTVTIAWEDQDPDSNAQISLYYSVDPECANQNQIVGNIPEDPDGIGDGYAWDVAGVPAGAYCIRAVITDGVSTSSSIAAGTVIIGPDSDSDGVIDSLDNCPATFNPDQLDTNGNGVGDACEPAQYRISGSAYNYPQLPPYSAAFSMDAAGPDSPSGWLRYYYSRTRMNFQSTAVTAVAMSGNTATIEGTGTVNGAGGYTFTATVLDSAPDSFGIAIRRPDDSIYYSTATAPTAGGNLSIAGF